MSLPFQVPVISTDRFTSEEVILAAIHVLERKLRFLRSLCQDISSEEAKRLRSLRQYYKSDKEMNVISSS